MRSKTEDFATNLNVAQFMKAISVQPNFKIPLTLYFKKTVDGQQVTHRICSEISEMRIFYHQFNQVKKNSKII